MRSEKRTKKLKSREQWNEKVYRIIVENKRIRFDTPI